MTCFHTRLAAGALLPLGLGLCLFAADPPKPDAPVARKDDKPAAKAAEKPPLPDLAGYRTTAQAIKAVPRKPSGSATGQAGYLGVATAVDGKGRLTVVEVEPDSPAARAGLQVGDVLVTVGGDAVKSSDHLRSLVMSRAPREPVKLAVLRQDRSAELTAVLAAASRPMSLSAQRMTLGVQFDRTREGDGAVVSSVAPDSGAAKAGLKSGDVVVKLDGAPVTGNAMIGDALTDKKPGDTVTVTVRRGGKETDLKVAVTIDRGDFGGRGRFGGVGAGDWDSRVGNYWKKDTYKLAIIGIEYPDVKHNDKVTPADWEESLFSRSKYVKKQSVTGQPVYGSMNDYYHELSCGAFHVEGKMFPWVEVGKKRAEYAAGSTGPGRTALLTEALDKLLKRDGKDALKGFDGVFFLYAGERPPGTNRGGIYWPHRSNVQHDGKRWPYFICPDGGSRMANISVFCHEFGHMLGLPDLYARPENPGSEGLGTWCAMSNQAPNGRPQHFSAWCKEVLGWLKPTVIDPTVKQKLILGPVENSTTECFKVLARPDGSEYFLLENRRRLGFDESLPSQGLLIWRVVGNRPILEESHGVEGPSGPRVFATSVPYPSAANTAFTPFTTPSSRSQLGGGLPVYITNIRALPDGRITFHIGYEYQ